MTEPDLWPSSWDFLRAENMPPCPRCGCALDPGQWISSDGAHHVCPPTD